MEETPKFGRVVKLFDMAEFVQKNMSFEERQELLRLVVDRVTVENGTARIDTVIPGPKDDGQLRARRSELVEPQRCGGLGPFRQ